MKIKSESGNQKLKVKQEIKALNSSPETDLRNCEIGNLTESENTKSESENSKIESENSKLKVEQEIN